MHDTTMQRGKRTFLGSLAAGATAPWLGAAHAKTAAYPNRSVSFVVPYPPGGTSDVVSRLVSRPLAAKLGQTVVVENVTGAGGIIAVNKVVNAPAQGHMLYRGTLSELVLAPLNVPSVRFTTDDFRLVQIMSLAELVLNVRKDLPANSIDEFLDYAATMAAQDKPLTYGSVGVGSVYHLLGERLSRLTGIEMLHVPYRGGSPADQALVSGEIDFYMLPVQRHHLEWHREGRLKILALLSETRRPQWSDYPAITEFARVKDLAFTMWGGFFVKEGTPEPIMQTLNQTIGEVLQDAGIRAALASHYQQVREPLSLAEADRVYQDGIAQFRDMARSAGLL